MSIHPKPSLSTFILLLLLLTTSLRITTHSSPDSDTQPGSDEESDDLEQLLAVDEQLQQDLPLNQQSEAETVSKAQRIVLELSGDNAKRVIGGNEFVMVLGYAPWCARSADLMPKFSEAATALKEIGSGIVMAKIDGDRYAKVASEMEIRGFPTLLLFVNGTSLAYTGGFSAEDIVIWVQKKTGSPIITVNTVDEAQRFLKKYHTFAVGLFNKFEGSEYNEFVKAAKLDNEIQFVVTSDKDVARLLFPELKTSNVFIGMVKTEAERYTAYDGSYKMEKILEFLGKNKFPLITKLSESNTAWVYSSPVKLQVMIFAKADDFQNMAQPLEDFARKFNSKLMFIYVDITNENLAMPFLTLFGVENANKTVVAAFDNKLNSKYLLESDPSPSNIEHFCSGLADGTLPQYYRSEPVPDNENASIVTVVGKTFDELVLNSQENVLLEVHTPWCVNCEAMSKQVVKLANHFKGFENLVFARIDASANENAKLQVNDYPTILLYKSGEKEKPLKLSTKLSAKDMAVFINEELKPRGGSSKDEL